MVETVLDKKDFEMTLAAQLNEVIDKSSNVSEAGSIADKSWDKMDMIAAVFADESKKLRMNIKKKDYAGIYRSIGWLIGMGGDLAKVAVPPNRRGNVEAETKAINQDMKRLHKERGDKMWFEED